MWLKFSSNLVISNSIGGVALLELRRDIWKIWVRYWYVLLLSMLWMMQNAEKRHLCVYAGMGEWSGAMSTLSLYFVVTRRNQTGEWGTSRATRQGDEAWAKAKNSFYSYNWFYSYQLPLITPQIQMNTRVSAILRLSNLRLIYHSVFFHTSTLQFLLPVCSYISAIYLFEGRKLGEDLGRGEAMLPEYQRLIH